MNIGFWPKFQNIFRLWVWKLSFKKNPIKKNFFGNLKYFYYSLISLLILLILHENSNFIIQLFFFQPIFGVRPQCWKLWAFPSTPKTSSGILKWNLIYFVQSVYYYVLFVIYVYSSLWPASVCIILMQHFTRYTYKSGKDYWPCNSPTKYSTYVKDISSLLQI